MSKDACLILEGTSKRIRRGQVAIRGLARGSRPGAVRNLRPLLDIHVKTSTTEMKAQSCLRSLPLASSVIKNFADHLAIQHLLLEQRRRQPIERLLVPVEHVVCLRQSLLQPRMDTSG